MCNVPNHINWEWKKKKQNKGWVLTQEQHACWQSHLGDRDRQKPDATEPRSDSRTPLDPRYPMAYDCFESHQSPKRTSSLSSHSSVSSAMVSAPLAQPISPTNLNQKPHLYSLFKNQENKQNSINVKNVPCKCPHRVHSLEANRRPCVVVVVGDWSLGLEKKIAQVELSQGLTRPSRKWVRGGRTRWCTWTWRKRNERV